MNDPNKTEPFMVDFSGPSEAKKMLRDRSKLTEYGSKDLSSGFPLSEIWVTKDGRKIAIPNLSDSHLVNIITFMLKRSVVLRRKLALRILIKGLAITTDALFHTLSDDHQDDISNSLTGEVMAIERMAPDEFLKKYFPIYSKLLQECYRRKITLTAFDPKEPLDLDDDWGSRTNDISHDGLDPLYGRDS